MYLAGKEFLEDFLEVPQLKFPPCLGLVPLPELEFPPSLLGGLACLSVGLSWWTGLPDPLLEPLEGSALLPSAFLSPLSLESVLWPDCNLSRFLLVIGLAL